MQVQVLPPVPIGESMKITAKQFAGFHKALTASGFNGITFNDAYNQNSFGITKLQYDALSSAADAILGMDARQVTLPMIRAFASGAKVAGARADSTIMARLTGAFPG